MEGITGLSTSFRPDIGGLRAIAVLAVMLFHFGIPGFSGGFAGVDIFFVISGFLMTKIVMAQREKKEFSLGRFYLSRLFRVMPPMLAMILALLGLGYFFLEPAEYLLLAKHAIAALLSIVDFLFYRETGYFTPSRESVWLLHLWSLSVEIQFYLLFPFVLLWACRGRGKAPMSRLAWLLAVSLVGCVALTFRDPSAAFYLVPARIWEFLAGSLAYLRTDALPPRGRLLTSWVGIAAIIAAILLLDSAVPFPGYAAILPVLGTAMVLWASSAPWLLTNPFSLFLGRISYSLYLWHWPVWVAAHHYGLAFSPGHVLEMLALCLALGIASYYAIEQPTNRLRQRGLAGVSGVALAGGTTSGLAFAGIVLAASGLPGRAPAMITDVHELYPLPADVRQDVCFISPPASGDAFAPACFDPPLPRQGNSVLFWGDSHAAHLWPGIAASRSFPAVRLLQATSGACPPLFVRKFDPDWALKGLIFDPATGINVHCDGINRRVLDEIERVRPSVIVLSARWAYYDTHGTDVVRDLHAVIDKLSPGRPRIIVIGPIPEWQPTLPQRAFQESFLHGGSVPERLHDPSHLAGEKLDRRMALSFEGTGVGYVSLFKLLCSEAGCITWASEDGERGLMQWDVAHLSKFGSKWIVAHAIAPAVLEALGSDKSVTNPS